MYTWDVGIQRTKDDPRAFRVALLRQNGNGVWISRRETKVGFFAHGHIIDRAVARLCEETRDPELNEAAIRSLQRWARFDAACERLGVYAERGAYIGGLFMWRGILVASDAANAIGRLRKRLQPKFFSQRRM